MELQTPITINLPPIRSSGGTRVLPPLTLRSLDVTLIDNAKRRSCVARIQPCPRPLTLWQGDAYDDAGDYTQAEAEARITELLGGDPAAVLAGLFHSPRVPPQC